MKAFSFQRGAFTDLVFLLILSCRGQELIGPSQPIKALIGDDVILPCHLEPAINAFTTTVEWTRPDLDPRFVFVWRDGLELENKKHETFRGRTSVFIEELRHGNVSLKLSNVKLSDGGGYRCFIPTLNKAVTVQLLVDQFFPAPTNPSSTHDPPGSPVVTISVTVCAALVLVPAVIFAVRKWRQNRLKNRKDHEIRTEQPEEEKTNTPERSFTESHVQDEGADHRETDQLRTGWDEEKEPEPERDQDKTETETQKKRAKKEEKGVIAWMRQKVKKKKNQGGETQPEEEETETREQEEKQVQEDGQRKTFLKISQVCDVSEGPTDRNKETTEENIEMSDRDKETAATTGGMYEGNREKFEGKRGRFYGHEDMFGGTVTEGNRGHMYMGSREVTEINRGMIDGTN